jgi:hypothetical protein
MCCFHGYLFFTALHECICLCAAPFLTPCQFFTVCAGDYYQALRVMEHIELDKKGLYSRVPACQVTVFYYVSFSYMMMGRSVSEHPLRCAPPHTSHTHTHTHARARAHTHVHTYTHTHTIHTHTHTHTQFTHTHTHTHTHTYHHSLTQLMQGKHTDTCHLSTPSHDSQTGLLYSVARMQWTASWPQALHNSAACSTLRGHLAEQR